MTHIDSPNAAKHYLGEEGKRYFQQQDSSGQLAATYNRHFFAPYLRPQDELLDFGCGGGHLLRTLNVTRKVGVDINPIALASAKEKGVETFNTLEALTGQTFSRIITSHALEHVPNPYQILGQLRSLLQKEGLLVWLSPMDSWHNRHQRQWKPNDFDHHLYAWTPLTIGNLVQATGYQVVEVRTITHAFPPRMGDKLWQTSPKLFHAVAAVWAAVINKRQILVVAKQGG